MSADKTEAEQQAAWEAERARPKFHHVIHETDGKLSRESYVYSTLAGSIELWRTPCLSQVDFHGYGYYGGVETHSATQLYDFHPGASHTNCKWTPSGTCWHDGSSLAFDRFANAFKSPNFIRAELKDWHESRFGKPES